MFENHLHRTRKQMFWQEVWSCIEFTNVWKDKLGCENASVKSDECRTENNKIKCSSFSIHAIRLIEIYCKWIKNVSFFCSFILKYDSLFASLFKLWCTMLLPVHVNTTSLNYLSIQPSVSLCGLNSKSRLWKFF